MKRTKNINKFISGIALLIGILCTQSCLKNSQYATDFSQVGASVDLPLSAPNNNGVESFSFNATVTDTNLPVYVNVASPSTPSKATSVTLFLDTASLNAYNTNNGTSFQVLPDSVYTTSGWSLSIPAGSRLDSMNVSFNFAKLDLTQAYVLPVSIQSASLPIEQWKTVLYAISVKNKYDGAYTVTGTMVDFANPNLTGDYPWNVYLVTSGPSSDILEDPNNGPIHLILNGTSTSYYGNFGVIFNFDPNTDAVVSVTNYYGQPSPNGRSATLDPSGLNQWNSSGMSVNYWMDQPAVITPHRTSFMEQYAYTGPRP